jgi:hypothetical protein
MLLQILELCQQRVGLSCGFIHVLTFPYIIFSQLTKTFKLKLASILTFILYLVLIISRHVGC